jgi:hypothetical protein
MAIFNSYVSHYQRVNLPHQKWVGMNQHKPLRHWVHSTTPQAQFTAVPQVDVKASLQSREEKVCGETQLWLPASQTEQLPPFFLKWMDTLGRKSLLW